MTFSTAASFCRPIISIFGAILIASLPQLSAAQQPEGAKPAFDPRVALACTKLRFQDFSGTQDAPATIADSQVVLKEGTPYCQVDGIVSGRTRFTARLPLAAWNGKIVEVGTGGQAGTIVDEARYVRLGGRPGLIARGYAFLAHDAGHVGARTGVDTLWGLNNRDAMIDYGFRSAHATAVIGKEIIRRFYGRPFDRAYYHSCSNGGREGMIMAQRYPWDFDGIIAAAPSSEYRRQVLGMFWLADQLRDQSRNGLDAVALTALHKSVIDQCDGLDGVRDGVLDDPKKCRIDFSRARCQKAATENCLTDRQISIAERLYAGPRRPDGSQILPPMVLPGSELGLLDIGRKYAGVDGTPYWFIGQYAADILRNLAFDPAPGPSWNPDPAKIDDYLKRMSLMDTLFSATNPDMRLFKDRGGKLLVYQGWNDVLGGVNMTTEYYENVERMMGGPARTNDFFRLFMMPGMNHCTGGEGAYEFDYLDALDRWVETGKGPDVLRGYHPKPDGSPEFYRDVKVYRTQRQH